ncbi:hypothetical protein ILP92_05875 [Maribius pontilimi]|uniref:Uncharacterized protein n=1 Tax=Palleronia pontilimi TaxID=1964209 RepID=A0A934M990_9RHOB|nr:hypothetical protein [Palleronia pontilimi]MBJ3762272.1 hypothetical protein [Palleronia pontilimi]
MIDALIFAAVGGLAIPLGGALALALDRTADPMEPWGYGAVALGGVALLAIFAAIAPPGPLAAAIGHVLLAGRDVILGLLMLFAAGGILYLVFEDVAPGAPARGSVLPPLGAVAGFGLSLAGHLARRGAG